MEKDYDDEVIDEDDDATVNDDEEYIDKAGTETERKVVSKDLESQGKKKGPAAIKKRVQFIFGYYLGGCVQPLPADATTCIKTSYVDPSSGIFRRESAKLNERKRLLQLQLGNLNETIQALKSNSEKKLKV